MSHAGALRSDVLLGFSRSPRRIPPRWFHDARGSELSERITRLPEYYPAAAEREILRERAAAIASATAARTLVEIGSGSSEKTGLLIDALGSPLTYVPVDISESALTGAAHALLARNPGLTVHAVLADFQNGLVLPAAPGPRLICFLGSTVGNLLPAERAAFLLSVRAALQPGDALLLGTDLVKDEATLMAAYDDGQGVTAAFNKNVLSVINRELGADFDPADFDHVAHWDAGRERIELRLRARRAVTARIPGAGLTVALRSGEEICTEVSAKFRREGLRSELAAAWLDPVLMWTDALDRYAITLAVPVPA
ncbi:L-histidine N(alpha)-methyltransferase [Streptomyces beijiangensis]|uniref:L-histidine N(Alpha)-methyltransferase n=1 Tax=Streptomyces beijiangensis TaxID=163361 RepID=A0A939JKU7_9ACTN|nr:L-histidine N(alpha)-methyltransferase [Streptomyces beijiangensis]MBO0516197.1 L-histidine N(alpha)-methyltransferase [Streptomyces beijiangensis]